MQVRKLQDRRWKHLVDVATTLANPGWLALQAEIYRAHNPGTDVWLSDATVFVNLSSPTTIHFLSKRTTLLKIRFVLISQVKEIFPILLQFNNVQFNNLTTLVYVENILQSFLRQNLARRTNCWRNFAWKLFILKIRSRRYRFSKVFNICQESQMSQFNRLVALPSF